MTDDPLERVTEVFADAGERLVEYADVWRSAIERNARDDYAAEDFLVDLQALWGMGVRDVALSEPPSSKPSARSSEAMRTAPANESTDEGGGGPDSS